jgi:UDP-3-O-[3-hydroxymyristoyl] glucosamine N-acyltransferase
VKLRDLAERLSCRLEADAVDVDVVRVASLEQAQPGDLTFLANPRYRPQLAGTRASAVLLALDDPTPAPCAVLRCANPYHSFAEAVGLLRELPAPAAGIDPLAAIAADAVLGTDVTVGPFVVIGSRATIGARTVIHASAAIGPGAHVGEDCVVHAHVSIREGVTLGNRVIVQNGAVIGSDGFGFVKQPDGSHMKIPQLADVVIEDDVEIGANTAIDRPAIGETRVRAGSKIDNLVQIAHGVSIGRNVLLASQVGIAGSTTLDDDVVLAGQVGVSGHLRIGKGVVATAQTGIPNSVDAGSFISGYPAIPNRAWLKSAAIFRHLPALKKQLAALEARIAELEEQINECRTRQIP